MDIDTKEFEQQFWTLASNVAGRVLQKKEKPIKPSEWAERKRVLSNVQGAVPGLWDTDNAPYLREIMDNFAPDSGCQEFVVMKATRLGFTSAMINVCGWIIDVHPCATRILIPNENTLKEVMTTMLNDMIMSSGLDGKIMATDNIKANKKTGNTTFTKTFAQGHIIGMSLNSKAAMASYAAEVMLVDEFDEMRRGQVKIKQEGIPDDTRTRVRDRTSTYGKRKRIVYQSMPTDADTSEVYKLFLDGDQRYYFVPCPYCGHYQRLRWQDEQGNYCFHYDVDDDGRYIAGSASLVCENEACGRRIHENEKYNMLRQGRWQATVEARDRALWSYQISALYSNFLSWDEIVEQWILAQGRVDRLKSFVKSILGEPWEDRQYSALWHRLQSVNRSTEVSEHFQFYWSAEELATIKYITAGIDVQDTYLECQIVGWADYFVAYDLHHLQIRATPEELEARPNEDPLSLAFEKLRAMIDADDWGSPYLGTGSHTQYMTKLFKKMARPVLILMDSRYRTNLAYTFASYFSKKRKGVYLSQGETSLTNGKPIEAKPAPSAGTQIIRMNTDLLKLEIDQAMRDSTFEHVSMNIQRTRSEKYFKGLASEHRVERGGRHYWVKNAGVKRNEVLDCWVMARAGVWYLATLLFKNKAVDWEKMFR